LQRRAAPSRQRSRPRPDPAPGQSAQFNTSPDKVTGDIVKLDTSLTVIK
jgi:hypothetical protein